MSPGDGRDFAGKVAFVTGAAGGIGRATALAFGRQGAAVTVCDLSEEANRETAEMIEAGGGRALPLACDVTSGEEVRAALRQTVEAFDRLDIAFNNAGVEQGSAPLAELEEAEWDRLIEIDLRSVFLGMKHQIPLLLEAGGGAIVNTSSAAGVIGIRSQAAYTAAKHAVIGVSRSAALDYAADGIRINAVCPGVVDTPMVERYSGGTAEGRERVTGMEPVGRLGRPEEVASAVLWLCSDLAAFTTGHAMVVDGAMTVGL